MARAKKQYKIIYKRIRGMVGIEAAIVLIAFVIVAAALAFVALNMGFFTTQKSKEVIARGLEEASSALEVDGAIIGKNNVTAKELVGIAIPLRLASGRNPVDIKRTSIEIVTADKVVVLSADNITPITNPSTSDPFAAAGTEKAALIEYQGDDDSLIEEGEKWVLVLNLTQTLGAGLKPYARITVEVKPPVGAPLTVARVVPPDLSETYVVLG